MQRISDVRMTGVSRRNFNMFRTLCGDATLKNVLIVTNMWGEVTEPIGAARERELATDNALFKPVLDKGARMVRHAASRESAHSILRNFVGKGPAVLQIQDEMVNQGKAVMQTAAGLELRRELDEQARKNKEEVERQRREAGVQAAAKEAERNRQVEEMRRRQTEVAELARQEQERIRAQQQAERARQEAERQEADRRLAEQRRAEEEQRTRAQRLEEEARRVRETQEAETRRLREQLEAEQRRLRQRQRGGGGDCMIQ